MFPATHWKSSGKTKESNKEENPLNHRLRSVAEDGLVKKGDKLSHNGPFRCKRGHTFTFFPFLRGFGVFNGASGRIGPVFPF